MAKNFYQPSVSEITAGLKTNIETGLGTKEASDLQVKYGKNELVSRRKISALKIFLGQFKDVLVIILLISAGASLGLALVEENGSLTEGLLIIVIVIAIAIVGFLNEYKAEKTVESLKRLVGLKARVIRNGEEIEVDAKDLVPGDLILIEEGQKVPADIRLISVISLQANEASLTGESQPVFKSVETISKESALGDQKNMLFSGTVLTAGKGTGLVVGTGQNTEIGKIATLVEEAEESETPMQKKLDRLGKQLGAIIILVCAVVFAVIFFLDKELLSQPFSHRLILAFTAAVALAVAAIPEGLAFVVRISLALGARRMAGRKALVRKLSAVEALGSTDIICSDKTGTLTKGEMTVREIWLPDKHFEITGSGYVRKGDFFLDSEEIVDHTALQRILTVGALCNNAKLRDNSIIGDPTEAALLVSAAKARLAYEKLQQQFRRVGEVPFTSDRKLMSTIHQTAGGFMVCSKGATEILLSRCQKILVDGKEQTLTDDLKQEILRVNQEMSAGALRVLGFAYKEVTARPGQSDEENNLVFIGLQGMMDPPRTEIKEVIEKVQNQAGMKVIMITGDYIETAKAIAKEIGIMGESLTGPELDQMSQEEFEKQVEKVAIYGRVNPEHKIRIVSALKSHGHQVAMTGDGVNDAPAIKAADIGIAMGITGTDVAKETADLILLDDQFLTIINAIEEGRGIFDNVRKFVNYLLSANIAEVLVVFFGILLFGDLVVTAAQLLFVNIVTDGLPAVALGSDPAEKGIMRFKPQRFQKEIIDKRLWLEMFIFGALMTLAIIIQFAIHISEGDLPRAVAGAFTAMVVLEMVRLVSIRSDYKVSWLANKWLMIAIISSLALQAAVLYVPFMAKIFGINPITGFDWLYILASSAVLFVVMKLVKRGLDNIPFSDTRKLATK